MFPKVDRDKCASLLFHPHIHPVFQGITFTSRTAFPPNPFDVQGTSTDLVATHWLINMSLLLWRLQSCDTNLWLYFTRCIVFSRLLTPIFCTAAMNGLEKNQRQKVRHPFEMSTVGSLFGLTRIASPEVQRLELIFNESL